MIPAIYAAAAVLAALFGLDLSGLPVEWFVASILTVHALSDFLFQSSWMAMGKSHQWKPLLAHIAVYTAALVPFGLQYALFNGVAHLVVDFVTSRVNARNYKAGKIRAFWIGIGVDQLLHGWALTLSRMVLGL